MATITVAPPATYNRRLFISADALYVAALVMFVSVPHDLYHKMALLLCVVMLVVAIARKTDHSLWLSCVVSAAAVFYFALR